MSREWKPGDVAHIDVSNGGAVGIWTGEFWAWSNGDGPFDGVSHCHRDVKARPLVVIDAEDSEQVDRFCAVLVERMYAAGDRASAANGVHPATVAAALREFANPTPARPEEPARWGVVEGRDGNRWVRTDESPNLRWRHLGIVDRRSSWEGIACYEPLVVLSDGVRAGESA